MTIDNFGITKLNETVGIEWFSNWNGINRTINSQGIDKRNADPNDSMSSLHCPSYSSEGNQLIIYGNGQAKLRGEHPRLYINKSNSEPLWQNVEMTVYGKFITPIIKSGSYTTFRLAGRSNHQAEYKCISNGKGYATEINLTQSTMKVKDARFRKELIHPHYANSGYNISILDMTNWLGMKFICKTVNNNVLLQTYIDTTDGLNGGDWQKIGEFTDDGTNWAINTAKELENIVPDCNKCAGDSDCKDAAPLPPYNEKILRKGVSCYLRSDFVQDCYFKKFSIREI